MLMLLVSLDTKLNLVLTTAWMFSQHLQAKTILPKVFFLVKNSDNIYPKYTPRNPNNTRNIHCTGAVKFAAHLEISHALGFKLFVIFNASWEQGIWQRKKLQQELCNAMQYKVWNTTQNLNGSCNDCQENSFCQRDSNYFQFFIHSDRAIQLRWSPENTERNQ